MVVADPLCYHYPTLPPEKKFSLQKLFAALLVPVEGSLLDRLALPARRARQGIWSALRSSLTIRPLPWLLAILAGLFVLPSIFNGWGLSDDLLHRQVLLTNSLAVAIPKLFTFLDPKTTPALMDQGSLPWWASTQTSISFWRPLAALSLWIDYKLWPNSDLLMRLHSVAWYIGLCLCAAFLYRRFMGRRVSAGLAAFLFVVNVPHFNTVAAVNARNVLQTAFFGLGAIYFHDRWRRSADSSPWYRNLSFWLAPACLLASLLSAEAGIAILAYLAAYAVCIERGSWKQRAASLIPGIATIAGWRIIYQSMHYGAFGSAFYIDPVREPLRFAASIFVNAPALLFGQWVMPDPGVFAALSMGARIAYWILAVLYLNLLVASLWPLLRRDRTARFWALGSLLAVIPVCAVNPGTGRHMIFVGLGALALLAQLVASLLEQQEHLPAHPAWRLPAWGTSMFLFLIQGIIFPILVLFLPAVLEGNLYNAMMDLGPLPLSQGQDVVVINAPSPGQSIYMLSVRDFYGQSMPAHLRILAPGRSPVEVTRLDPRTLLVQPEYGYLLNPGARTGTSRDWLPVLNPAFATQYGESFFRSPYEKIPLGTQVKLTGATIQVTALTKDGRPLQIRVTFDRPLEDTTLRWLQWDWSRQKYVPFRLPQVGETIWTAGPF